MNWKVITSVLAVIATLASLAGGLTVFYDKVAWADQVQQSLSILGKGTQLQVDNNYLETLQDRRRNVIKILERSPSDVYSKEELDYLNDRIKAVRERIETTSRELGHGQ